MSYDIVRSIKIKDNEVWINCACNNVSPRLYETYKSDYFTNILKTKGLKATEVELLKSYEEGSFQAGTENKYTRALKVLRYFYAEEYKPYDWRTESFRAPNFRENKEKEEYNQLLLKALNTKLPKIKYVISKEYGQSKYYLKQNKNSASWKAFPEKATIFDFKTEAENTIKGFSNTANWIIQEVKK